MSNFKFSRHVLLPVILGSSIGLLAAWATKAEAQQADPGEYCNAIATYAENVAEARNRGVPLVNVLTLLNKAPDGTAKNDMITVVSLVFTPPHVAPDLEAGLIFDVCWQTYGE